mmetsp:Transcript_12561/g.24551  ORF Transcript_12561/g.24551 Transcript_12561/m.24551 type:complete len:434 (+) Transcript_12561:54-1355(+)
MRPLNVAVLANTFVLASALRFLDYQPWPATTKVYEQWSRYHNPVRDGWEQAIDDFLRSGHSGDEFWDTLVDQVRQQLAKVPVGATNAPDVGMFDSGIGGLTVYAELKREMPSVSVAFLSDVEGPGYSHLTWAGVAKRALGDVAWLEKARAVHATLVTCNLASIAMLRHGAFKNPQIRSNAVLPIIPPLKEFFDVRARLYPNKRKIGILSTDQTCLSGLYQRAIRNSSGFVILKNSVEMPGQANTSDCIGCSECHEAIDRGAYAEDVERTLRQKLRSYLDDHGKPVIDYLVLGCTHFPVLSRVLLRVLGRSVQIVDPAVYQAKLTARLFRGQKGTRVTDEFYIGASRAERGKYELTRAAMHGVLDSLAISTELAFSLAPCADRLGQQGVCRGLLDDAMWSRATLPCPNQVLRLPLAANHLLHNSSAGIDGGFCP